MVIVVVVVIIVAGCGIRVSSWLIDGYYCCGGCNCCKLRVINEEEGRFLKF